MKALNTKAMSARIMFGFATIAGLALMLGGSVTAASADAPRWDVRHDRQDIRQDARDIRRDNTDIRQDRRQIGRLDGRLTYAVNHDRFGVAKQVAARITGDRHDIRRDRQDVKHDVRDLRQDRNDLRHDR